eukprot:839048-Amphidinium_carterae.1
MASMQGLLLASLPRRDSTKQHRVHVQHTSLGFLHNRLPSPHIHSKVNKENSHASSTHTDSPHDHAQENENHMYQV